MIPTDSPRLVIELVLTILSGGAIVALTIETFIRYGIRMFNQSHLRHVPILTLSYLQLLLVSFVVFPFRHMFPSPVPLLLGGACVSSYVLGVLGLLTVRLYGRPKRGERN